MREVDKLSVLIPALFVLEQEVIYTHEYHRLVAMTEVNLSLLDLIDSTYVHLWTKLAYYNVRVVDLSTNDLTIAVNACHNVVCWMQVSTQNSFLMLV